MIIAETPVSRGVIPDQASEMREGSQRDLKKRASAFKDDVVNLVFPDVVQQPFFVFGKTAGIDRGHRISGVIPQGGVHRRPSAEAVDDGRVADQEEVFFVGL